MKTKKVCKKCNYWVRDWDWDSTDKRIMGNCHFAPPYLCQTLIPAVIRDSGYSQLKVKQEQFQLRPIVQSTSFCANFKQKGKI